MESTCSCSTTHVFLMHNIVNLGGGELTMSVSCATSKWESIVFRFRLTKLNFDVMSYLSTISR